MNVFDNDESRDWLRSLLKEGVCTVNFTKTDGTDRSMKCTLESGRIPVETSPTGKPRQHSNNVCCVFDIESNHWKSFRWDSIKEVIFE